MEYRTKEQPCGVTKSVIAQKVWVKRKLLVTIQHILEIVANDNDTNQPLRGRFAEHRPAAQAAGAAMRGVTISNFHKICVPDQGTSNRITYEISP